jgi:uncharacterized protein (TIGR03086 family)
MVSVAILYAITYRMRMPTIASEFRPLHRIAVLNSIDVVNAVRLHDLNRPTPCAGWNLLDLLAHMTVQHRGFAAAALGSGADPDAWRPENVLGAVIDDPAGTYADAARDVLGAFATDGASDVTFALPDFGPGASFPGAVAMDFHFIDYVVHGWDVAATLGIPYALPADVVTAALPLALFVPDGDFRAIDGAPFGPVLDADGTDDLDRILRHLGRRPDWAQQYSTVTGA